MLSNMMSNVRTNGPAFLLRMSCARSFSFATSDSPQLHREHLKRIVRFQDVVQSEAVDGPALEVRRRVRERQRRDESLPLWDRQMQADVPCAGRDRRRHLLGGRR